MASTEEITTVQMGEADARALTEEVKADAAALWAKLLTLYEGGAHIALGYGSWGDYYEAEFGESGGQGYRLLRSARVARELGPVANWQLKEAVARELVPLLGKPDVMAAAVEAAGPDATAERMHEEVQKRVEDPTPPGPRPGQQVHYSSASEEWSTPDDLYAVLDAEFGFTLDVCASPLNAKCDRFFDRSQDGLSQPWEGVCWMNPPYGDGIGAWVAKARESAAQGATVVCLVPSRTDTGWFWDHCRFGEVRFLRGRLKFGGGDTGAPFPSVVVVFGTTERVTWWDWKGDA